MAVYELKNVRDEEEKTHPEKPQGSEEYYYTIPLTYISPVSSHIPLHSSPMKISDKTNSLYPLCYIAYNLRKVKENYQMRRRRSRTKILLLQ